jgi:hypothetical protein
MHFHRPSNAKTARTGSSDTGRRHHAPARHTLPLWLVLLAAIAAEPCLAQSPPAPLALQPQQGVLLLRSGRTLQGRYTRDGDRYYLALPSGEIRIRANEVEAALPSLEDCYRYRRHELLGGAAEQLAVAIMIDARHPRADLLERRLNAARTQAKPVEAAAAETEETISADDLEKFCKSLPAGTVELFTSSIQPLLQNSCGNAACHGSRSPTAFRMMRAPANQAPSSRLTQRNLYAVLQMVNRESPTSSPLLTVPIRPHGPVDKPLFKQHDAAQYRELVRWVLLACGNTSKPQPATVQLKPPALMVPPLEAAPLDKPTRTDRQVQQASAVEDKPASPSKMPDRLERAVDPAASRSAPGTTAPRASDPFHPELFNRRFFPEGKPEQRPAGTDTADANTPPEG